jgi:hypothetical protein
MNPVRLFAQSGLGEGAGSMAFDDQEDAYSGRARFITFGGGMLRIVLLFSAVAVAIAVIASQALDRRINRHLVRNNPMSGVDYAPTGSINYKDRYTIRRSVLQPSPESICIVRDNGTRAGDC